ncbi:MAG: oligopeptide/dipeptide ABC transporter ATP-binding protein [Pseudomonadota bacterium]
MSLLRIEDLSVTFDVRGRGDWPWTPVRKLQAVRALSFEVAEGETLGVVGESGSGKSTLARAIVGTVPASGGKILWDGSDLAALGPAQRRKHRKSVQMIFQDPLAALNPRMTVGEIIAEPLRTHHPDTAKPDMRRKVGEMMERVGLLPNLVNRYPHEFSGGQCQRIGIARALILGPKLVLCDEPVSALDVSVQAQVVNLLQALKRDMGLSLIFIAHDLSVVKHISDRIAVMYLGTLLEIGAADQVCRAPRHPYTKALISAVPVPDPAVEKARRPAVLEGELPSPMAPPSGCVFRTRCPVALPRCADQIPALRWMDGAHAHACPVVAAEAQHPA